MPSWKHERKQPVVHARAYNAARGSAYKRDKAEEHKRVQIYGVHTSNRYGGAREQRQKQLRQSRPTLHLNQLKMAHRWNPERRTRDIVILEIRSAGNDSILFFLFRFDFFFQTKLAKSSQKFNSIVPKLAFQGDFSSDRPYVVVVFATRSRHETSPAWSARQLFRRARTRPTYSGRRKGGACSAAVGGAINVSRKSFESVAC